MLVVCFEGHEFTPTPPVSLGFALNKLPCLKSSSACVIVLFPPLDDLTRSGNAVAGIEVPEHVLTGSYDALLLAPGVQLRLFLT